MRKKKPPGKPRRPGRPRGPCSPKELAQRRAAPLKTGEHAQTALGQALPPCKPKTCPNEGTGTCDVKRAVEARGGGLASCLVALGGSPAMDAYLAALRTGDLKGLAELTAASLAGQLVLGQSELALLLQEGLTVEQPIVGRMPDGGTDVIGHRPAENPRAALALKLLAQLGHTAADQALTPKSSGERNRDEGIGSLASRAAWISRMRTGLAGDEDSGDA